MFNCIKLINDGFRKQVLKESLGSDIAKYQKWVDYDMERYNRISDKTLEEIKKAGLSVVKDQYGEYEVITKSSITESTQDLFEDSDRDLFSEIKDILGDEYTYNIKAPHLYLTSLDSSEKEEVRKLLKDQGIELGTSIRSGVYKPMFKRSEDQVSSVALTQKYIKEMTRGISPDKPEGITPTFKYNNGDSVKLQYMFWDLGIPEGKGFVLDDDLFEEMRQAVIEAIETLKEKGVVFKRADITAYRGTSYIRGGWDIVVVKDYITESFTKSSITESTQDLFEDSDINHIKELFCDIYEKLLKSSFSDDDDLEEFRELIDEYRTYTGKDIPVYAHRAFEDVPEDKIKNFWDGYLYQYENDSLNEANLYEDVNIENEPDNEVLRGILLSRGNKKLTPEEQEVLDKYGFKVDTRGGVKSIYSPETGRKLSLFNHKYDGWTLYVTIPESGGRDLRYFNSRADAEASKIDIIKLLSTSRDANSSFMYNRQVYPFGSSSIDYYDRRKDYVEDDLAKLKDKLVQAKEELLNYTEGTSQYYQAKAKIADIESRISSLYADRKDVQKELEAERRKRNMYDADGFSQRRYQQDVVNNNIAKYKELKYRLDSAKKSVEYYGRETNSVAKQRRKDNLLSQIAQLQREIERLDSNTTASDQLYREAVASVDELTAEVAKLLHKDRSSK